MANTTFNTQASANNYGINPNTQKTWGGMLGITPQQPAPVPPAQHQSPTTPVKSITTNPDGSSTSTYQAPTAGMFSGGSSAPEVGVSSAKTLQSSGMIPTPKAPDDPSYMYRTDNGQLNTNYTGYKAQQTQGSAGTTAPVGNTTATQIPNVANAGVYTPQEQQALETLTAQSQNPSTEYNQAYNQYQNTYQQLAALQGAEKDTMTNIGAQGISLDSSRGQMANVAQNYYGKEAALGAQEQAAMGALGAANQQQGLQVQAGTAAQAGAQNQAQRNLAGQEAVLGAVQPQPYGIMSTPYNPATGQFGTMPGGTNGAANAGIIQSQFQAGNTYGQNSAIIGKVQSQLPALQQAMQKDSFNPTDVTYLNQLDQWAKGNLSDSAIPEVQGSLNDIIGGLSQVLGVPSAGGSDFRLQFAGSLVNALQSGQSINDAVNFAVNQAISGNQGYLQGAKNATQTAGQSTPLQSKVVSGSYTQNADGDWVYHQ